MPLLAISDSLHGTIGLVLIFFVIFPVIAQGLIAFAVAQALGERAENEKDKGKWGLAAKQRMEADRRL
ncbi:MAG: hypothetical protein QOG77_3275 [Solirubrobacteraceae bacterium]|jgi:hypothetical protein|nr:hypothetical protein [Solirubrobacteraceae bacterium]